MATIALAEADQQQLRTLIHDAGGVDPLARKLRIDRYTLAKAAAGDKVQAGSAALIRELTGSDDRPPGRAA